MAAPVGFIGLGNMGRPMAENLVKHGFFLVVHDVDSAETDPLRDRGAAVAASPEAVAARVTRTIVMVETTAQAEEVIAGERGVIQSAQAGHIAVCMSTIDPFAARRLGDRLGARGVAMLDAPVSGGTGRAASGELSVIAGGARETFDACRDLFEAMGAKLFHVGGLGQGLAMKLINNMLVQVNMVAVAEALVMGVKAGLDPQAIYDVVRVSTGTSYAFEHGAPKMLARDFSLGGSVDIYFKDQELETAFAKQLGVPLLLANLTQQVYQMARAAGLNKQDGSAILQVLERLAGVHVARPDVPGGAVEARRDAAEHRPRPAGIPPRGRAPLRWRRGVGAGRHPSGARPRARQGVDRRSGAARSRRPGQPEHAPGDRDDPPGAIEPAIARCGGTDAGRHRPGLRHPHAAPGAHPGDRRAGLCEPLRRGGAAGDARLPAVGGGRKAMRLTPVIGIENAQAVESEIQQSPAMPRLMEELQSAFPVLRSPESP